MAVLNYTKRSVNSTICLTHSCWWSNTCLHFSFTLPRVIYFKYSSFSICRVQTYYNSSNSFSFAHSASSVSFTIRLGFFGSFEYEIFPLSMFIFLIWILSFVIFHSVCLNFRVSIVFIKFYKFSPQFFSPYVVYWISLLDFFESFVYFCSMLVSLFFWIISC